MRAGGLGGGPCKIEESKRKHFSVSTLGSPTKPLTRAVRRLTDRTFVRLNHVCCAPRALVKGETHVIITTISVRYLWICEFPSRMGRPGSQGRKPWILDVAPVQSHRSGWSCAFAG